MTQSEAIIEAIKALGGTRNKYEIEDLVSKKFGDKWKDFGASMADMVPISRGGNNSSNVREGLRVLERVSPGEYLLLID